MQEKKVRWQKKIIRMHIYSIFCSVTYCYVSVIICVIINKIYFLTLKNESILAPEPKRERIDVWVDEDKVIECSADALRDVKTR